MSSPRNSVNNISADTAREYRPAIIKMHFYYKFSLEVAKDVFVWFPRSRGSVDNFSDFPPMMPDLPETLLAEGKFNQVLVNDDLKYFVFEVGGRIRNEC